MKIEDVEIGKQYRTNNGMVGEAMNSRRDTFFDGRYEVKLVSDTWSRWVHVKDLEPVEESPKEVPVQIGAYPTPISIAATPPQVSIGMTINDQEPLMQFRPQGKLLSIADTPVSQMTYRMYLIAQGFAGWAADSRADDRDITAIPTAADELIAEMERTKK